MKRLWPLLLPVLGCSSLETMPPDQPCQEAGWAISRRTLECTGDADLAAARHDLFEQTYTCVEVEDWDTAGGAPAVRDLYHCAFAIGDLACELVKDYGDDLDAWLSSSEACAWVVTP